MLITLLSLSLFAYQRADFAVQERYRVDYVTLDVKVVDRDGNPVTDLKLSDFEIKENRKRVQPDYFDALDYRQDVMIDELPLALEARQAKVKEEVRQIIIALDLEWTTPKDTRLAMIQLRKFLESLPTDVVYRINLYSLERGSISKGFVDTPARVLAYLDEYQERRLAKFDRRSTLFSSGESGMLDYGVPKKEYAGTQSSGQEQPLD
jgi:hypothetical protein